MKMYYMYIYTHTKDIFIHKGTHQNTEAHTWLVLLS